MTSIKTVQDCWSKMTPSQKKTTNEIAEYFSKNKSGVRGMRAALRKNYKKSGTLGKSNSQKRKVSAKQKQYRQFVAKYIKSHPGSGFSEAAKAWKKR